MLVDILAAAKVMIWQSRFEYIAALLAVLATACVGAQDMGIDFSKIEGVEEVIKKYHLRRRPVPLPPTIFLANRSSGRRDTVCLLDVVKTNRADWSVLFRRFPFEDDDEQRVRQLER